MNEVARQYIDDLFETIRIKMEGGKICGETVDPFDYKMMVVAAYLLGTMEYSPSIYTERTIYGE